MLWVQMVALECSRTAGKHCIPWTFSPCANHVYTMYVHMYLYGAVVLLYTCSYCILACTLRILLLWLINSHSAMPWIMSEHCPVVCSQSLTINIQSATPQHDLYTLPHEYLTSEPTGCCCVTLSVDTLRGWMLMDNDVCKTVPLAVSVSIQKELNWADLRIAHTISHTLVLMHTWWFYNVKATLDVLHCSISYLVSSMQGLGLAL